MYPTTPAPAPKPPRPSFSLIAYTSPSRPSNPGNPGRPGRPALTIAQVEVGGPGEGALRVRNEARDGDLTRNPRVRPPS